MATLINQFDLKPTATFEQFDAAWAAFGAYLCEAGLAEEVGPVMHRVPDSGFDTDSDRTHRFVAFIVFRDRPQSDAAWAAIETDAEPLARLHRRVIRLVHNPIFTFWAVPH